MQNSFHGKEYCSYRVKTKCFQTMHVGLKKKICTSTVPDERIYRTSNLMNLKRRRQNLTQ